MKRTLFLLTVVVLFAAFAIAQTSPSTSSSTTASPSTSSSSATTPQSDTSSAPSSSAQTSSPSGSSMSQSSAGTSAGNSLDGCIVKQESDYFVQPIDGGSRVKLNSTDDLSAHVGHHVKLTGTSGAGDTSKSASGSSMGSKASSSDSGSTFNVTKIDMVSTSCPASAK